MQGIHWDDHVWTGEESIQVRRNARKVGTSSPCLQSFQAGIICVCYLQVWYNVLTCESYVLNQETKSVITSDSVSLRLGIFQSALLAVLKLMEILGPRANLLNYSDIGPNPPNNLAIFL